VGEAFRAGEVVGEGSGLVLASRLTFARIGECKVILEQVLRRCNVVKLLVRWVIAALALFVAALLIPGIRVEGVAWIVYAVVAVILGLVNALVRPLLKFLTCPLILLTLGLFTLVINGVTLWLTAWIANKFGVGFYVEGFWPAFLGGLVVSVVTVILSALVKEEKD
jgi:putative membrane protein